MRGFISSETRHSALVAACLILGWANLPLLASGNEAAASHPTDAAPSRQPNRLINEKSPYLRQHAYNPVDWYPWGEEAFAKARKENKPIFLSIGYSTCHWCQVMARESFEDVGIAGLMNSSFVCIKVDREERPDLDDVFLAFVEGTTGNAGWPMTVFLTPDLKPFFGGSYFPPEDKQGRPGLRSILKTYAAAWKADSNSIKSNSDAILADLRKRTLVESPPERIDHAALENGYRQLASSFDPKHGGFGGAPKFPRPSVLAFLFQFYAAAPRSDQGRNARDMALFTLRKMAEGGIHDQIGGGFHRYSVDDSWRVPHFEKMLYDQAQLAECYLAAYQITHEGIFAGTARDILDFVRRDMTSPEGGFLSALGADSPIARGSLVQGEGAFYVWTRPEVGQAAGADRAKLIDFYYGVESRGNAPDDPQGEFPGKNILFQRHTVAETARMAGCDEAQAARVISESQSLLRNARGARPQPNLDDKVLASWNGLMISAFSRGYQVLNDPTYLRCARDAAAFVKKAMYSEQSGLLVRSYRGGPSTIGGFADDYAFMTQGLLDLYEASFDVHVLQWAERLQKQQNLLFWDPSNFGYFGTTGMDATVLMRTKPEFDGAEPSANSIAALNLLRLGAILDDPAYRSLGEKTVEAFAGRIHQAPTSLCEMLIGVDWMRNPPKQIVIDGVAGAPDTSALVEEIHHHFIPRKTVILADGEVGQEYLSRRVEFFRNLPESPPRPAVAYVCENYVCRLPTDNLATFAGLLAHQN